MKTINAADYALRFINQTNQHVFLTGKAGTGKTTLLREIIKTTHKNTVVVAPTGIAALNAGGVTIHSMFQLPFAGFIPQSGAVPQFSESVRFETRDSLKRHFKMSGLRKAVIRNMELLIIDEVSMLRADLLDAIDFMMRTVRKQNKPFGGVQLLYIGDLLQLPPVVKNEEWNVLRLHYKGKFFFHSHVVQQFPPIYIELSKIYRQTDSDFIEILNNLRNNTISPENIRVLNGFVQPDFDSRKNPGYITLTTHNHKADVINVDALRELSSNPFHYNAEIVGEFPDKIFPVDQTLELKVGAQIMFVKNDPSSEKNYFNGKTGTIESLGDFEIRVHFPDERRTIEVDRYEWQNIRYFVDPDTKEISDEILGTFVHYPIKLAWAITVHKSQGLTFDKAALDVSNVFAPGQAYVALSRLRSLNGLVLLSPLRMNDISNDIDVMQYSETKAVDDLLETELQRETSKYIHKYLTDSFDWDELLQQWRSHKFSYDQHAEKSEKTRNFNWAKGQFEVIEKIAIPAQQFIRQLDTLFATASADKAKISERVNAAVEYFLPVLDSLVSELLIKIELVGKVKKAKAFYNELLELEEFQTNSVLRLLRAQLLIKIVVDGGEICKENLTNSEIRTYRADKLAAIRKQLGKDSVVIIDDDMPSRYSKTQKPKGEKKSTVEETYQLWLQKKSIAEIAEIRKLTQQTIGGHIAKLIESNKINLDQILAEAKIRALSEAFEDYHEETLNGLKEKHGARFTWDELKMYKASLSKITV